MKPNQNHFIDIIQICQYKNSPAFSDGAVYHKNKQESSPSRSKAFSKMVLPRLLMCLRSRIEECLLVVYQRTSFEYNPIRELNLQSQNKLKIEIRKL